MPSDKSPFASASSKSPLSSAAYTDRQMKRKKRVYDSKESGKHSGKKTGARLDKRARGGRLDERRNVPQWKGEGLKPMTKQRVESDLRQMSPSKTVEAFPMRPTLQIEIEGND
jgi:hypothetical protein